MKDHALLIIPALLVIHFHPFSRYMGFLITKYFKYLIKRIEQTRCAVLQTPKQRQICFRKIWNISVPFTDRFHRSVKSILVHKVVLNIIWSKCLRKCKSALATWFRQNVEFADCYEVMQITKNKGSEVVPSFDNALNRNCSWGECFSWHWTVNLRCECSISV